MRLSSATHIKKRCAHLFFLVSCSVCAARFTHHAFLFFSAAAATGNTASRSQEHGNASWQRGMKPQEIVKYMREARKVAKVFGKVRMIDRTLYCTVHHIVSDQGMHAGITCHYTVAAVSLKICA